MSLRKAERGPSQPPNPYLQKWKISVRTLGCWDVGMSLGKAERGPSQPPNVLTSQPSSPLLQHCPTELPPPLPALGQPGASLGGEPLGPLVLGQGGADDVA